MADHLGPDLFGFRLRPPAVDFFIFLFLFPFELVAAIRGPDLGFFVSECILETARPFSLSFWGRLMFVACVGRV